MIKHKCIIPGGAGDGRGRLDPNYTSDIINVPSYNPIKSRARLRRASVSLVAIAAALIEAALRRDDAVYLHLGGQEEPNWLTMIMLRLIRPRAGIFSTDYTELDKRD